MRDGLVWSKSILFRIETYGHPAYWSGDFRIEFPLLITIQSVPRFEYFDGHSISPQLYLHSNYEIGRPSGCTICVHGWVRFTPYANPADVRRLMQLDLSCLTRWRPCVSQSDVMPVAWDQHLAELSRPTGDQDHTACSPSMLEALGRDSTNIVIARIVRSHKTAEGLTVSARTLEQLKGHDLKVGETLDMRGWRSAEDSATGPQDGSLTVLFAGFRARSPWISPPDACMGTPTNETTLNLIRRGIAQDYGAADKAQVD